MQTDQPASPPAAALPPRSELAILQGSGVPLDLVTKVDTPDQMPSDSALGLFRVRPKASQQQPQCTHGSPDIKHYLNIEFLPPALMSKMHGDFKPKMGLCGAMCKHGVKFQWMKGECPWHALLICCTLGS